MTITEGNPVGPCYRSTATRMVADAVVGSRRRARGVAGALCACILVAGMLAVPAEPACAQVSAWMSPIENVSQSPGTQVYTPRVNSNGWVTWMSQGDIWLFDGISKQNVSSSPKANDYRPRINNSGWLTWYSTSGGSSYNNRIHVWDGSTTVVLRDDCTDLGAAKNPEINDHGWVTWQDTYYGPNWNILQRINLWDTEHDQVIYAIGGYWLHPPVINNHGIVAWPGTRPPGVAGTWYWDGEHHLLECMRMPYVMNNAAVSINDSGWVVWHEQSSDRKSSYEVILWDGEQYTNLSRNTDLRDELPMVGNNGWVSWNGSGADGNHVWLWDGSTARNITWDLTTTYHYLQGISDDGGVLWRGHDGHSWNLFYRFPEGKTYQVTNTEFDVYDGHIAGDWITWVENGEVWRTQVTPELSTGALLVLGGLPIGLAWWRRRRQS